MRKGQKVIPTPKQAETFLLNYLDAQVICEVNPKYLTMANQRQLLASHFVDYIEANFAAPWLRSDDRWRTASLLFLQLPMRGLRVPTTYYGVAQVLICDWGVTDDIIALDKKFQHEKYWVRLAAALERITWRSGIHPFTNKPDD